MKENGKVHRQSEERKYKATILGDFSEITSQVIA